MVLDAPRAVGGGTRRRVEPIGDSGPPDAGPALEDASWGRGGDRRRGGPAEYCGAAIQTKTAAGDIERIRLPFGRGSRGEGGAGRSESAVQYDDSTVPRRGAGKGNGSAILIEAAIGAPSVHSNTDNAVETGRFDGQRRSGAGIALPTPFAAAAEFNPPNDGDGAAAAFLRDGRENSASCGASGAEGQIFPAIDIEASPPSFRHEEGEKRCGDAGRCHSSPPDQGRSIVKEMIKNQLRRSMRDGGKLGPALWREIERERAKSIPAGHLLARPQAVGSSKVMVSEHSPHSHVAGHSPSVVPLLQTRKSPNKITFIEQQEVRNLYQQQLFNDGHGDVLASLPENDACAKDCSKLPGVIKGVDRTLPSRQIDRASSPTPEGINISTIGADLTSAKCFRTWNERLEELVRYKAKHGHIIVPRMSGELGELSRWVGDQRMQLKKFKTGQKSAMTADRATRLEKIGFCADASFLFGGREDEGWNSMLEELKHYKAEHGHTVVPKSYGKLGEWVSTQRKLYKKFKTGQMSKMAAERATRLKEIGFCFNARFRLGGMPQDKGWTGMLEELKQYKAEHGHTIVPQRYGKLGRWVKDQRMQLKKLRTGQKPAMTANPAAPVAVAAVAAAAEAGSSISRASVVSPLAALRETDQAKSVRFCDKFNDGAVWGDYIGDLDADGRRHGKGKITYENGTFYNGGWENNKRDGQGSCRFKSGWTYDGGWKNDKEEGRGVDRRPDGTKYYEGEYKNGKQEGHGTQWCVSGNKYDGEWREGEREGQGVYTWANGDSYTGGWKDYNKREGKGIYRHADGRVEIRVYRNNKVSGEGVRWSKNRKTAWLLNNGKVSHVIELSEAKAKATRMRFTNVP